MAPRKGKEKKEEQVISLGPQVAEGENVFGVCHIFASFNDTFVHVTDLSGKWVLTKRTWLIYLLIHHMHTPFENAWGLVLIMMCSCSKCSDSNCVPHPIFWGQPSSTGKQFAGWLVAWRSRLTEMSLLRTLPCWLPRMLLRGAKSLASLPCTSSWGLLVETG